MADIQLKNKKAHTPPQPGYIDKPEMAAKLATEAEERRREARESDRPRLRDRLLPWRRA